MRHHTSPAHRAGLQRPPLGGRPPAGSQDGCTTGGPTCRGGDPLWCGLPACGSRTFSDLIKAMKSQVPNNKSQVGSAPRAHYPHPSRCAVYREMAVAQRRSSPSALPTGRQGLAHPPTPAIPFRRLGRRSQGSAPVISAALGASVRLGRVSDQIKAKWKTREH